MKRLPALAILVAFVGSMLVAAAPTVSSAVASYLRTSSGTVLSVAAISDTQCLTRSGTTIAGATCGGAPSGAAAGDLSGTYPNPTVARVAGTTPGAGGLAVLDDASTAAVLATVGGQAADAGLTSLTSADAAAGLPYVSAANTWTAVGSLASGDIFYASSASALARLAKGSDGDVLTLASGLPSWAAPSSSACVSSASSPTANDDSGDGYVLGKCWTNTTTDVIYFLADASVGAAVWRPVLSGATRIYCYISAGNPLAVRQALSGTTWVNIGTPVPPDTTQADVAATITPSGTGYTSAAGYGTASDQMSEAWRAIWKIDGTGNLGVTWTPSTTGTMVVSSFTSDQSTTTYHLEGGVIGHATAPATWTFGGGLGHALSNPALVGVSDNDTTTSVACTTTVPGVAILISSAAASARTAIVVGRSDGGATVEDTFSAVGASWASPSVGLWAGRPVLGGGTLTVTNLTAAFDFLPGELAP